MYLFFGKFSWDSHIEEFFFSWIEGVVAREDKMGRVLEKMIHFGELYPDTSFTISLTNAVRLLR